MTPAEHLTKLIREKVPQEWTLTDDQINRGILTELNAQADASWKIPPPQERDSRDVVAEYFAMARRLDAWRLRQGMRENSGCWFYP